MKIGKRTGIFLGSFFISLLLLSGCTRRNCSKKQNEYARLSFGIRDGNTHLPLIAAPAAVLNAPDSIGLRNITTNAVYPLHIAAGAYKEAVFFVPGYKGKAGTVDILEFRFGSSRRDTLTITVGTIKGWRGDECGSVDDPGIVEVKQNGTTIYLYQQYLDSAFVLKK